MVYKHLNKISYKNQIGQKNVNGISHTFTVMRNENKVLFNYVFSYNSPQILSMTKTGVISTKIRRAKLYFLYKKNTLKKENQ